MTPSPNSPEQAEGAVPADAAGYNSTTAVLRQVQSAIYAARQRCGPSAEISESLDMAGDLIAIVLTYSPQPSAPFEPDEATRAKVAQAIDENPRIASLLYDIDLMPEQIKDERRYGYMLAVIDHFSKPIDLLRRIRSANMIQPSMLVNNSAAYAVLTEIDDLGGW